MNEYRRLFNILIEARRLTRKELGREAEELVSGDRGVNWTLRGAKKAIRRAEAAGTPRLSPTEHKGLQGRGWSTTPRKAAKAGVRPGPGISDSPGPLHARHPGVGSIEDLSFHRDVQRRPLGKEGEGKKAVINLGAAVDRGDTPPAIATRHIGTGRLTQHAGRTRHTASKLTGGEGAEFAVISNADRRRALKSQLRRNKRYKTKTYFNPGGRGKTEDHLRLHAAALSHLMKTKSKRK